MFFFVLFFPLFAKKRGKTDKKCYKKQIFDQEMQWEAHIHWLKYTAVYYWDVPSFPEEEIAILFILPLL